MPHDVTDHTRTEQEKTRVGLLFIFYFVALGHVTSRALCLDRSLTLL